MSWFDWIQRYPELPAEYAARRQHYLNLPRYPANTALDTCDFIVLDTETSGLDLQRDRLLSIGAVRVHAMQIESGSPLHLTLRQEVISDKDNILIHGLTPSAQTSGLPTLDAMATLLDYVKNYPIVAFHAPFDRHFIQRAVKSHLGCKFKNRWIDLAWLLPGLFSGEKSRSRSLDAWLTQYNLSLHQRHSALIDAWLTAQLFLIALKTASCHKVVQLRSLERIASSASKLAYGVVPPGP